MRELQGESTDAIYDWLEDELARYSHLEHLCYDDDPVFAAKDVVASTIRRLKKASKCRATGRRRRFRRLAR
jgi:hypothetical protein